MSRRNAGISLGLALLGAVLAAVQTQATEDPAIIVVQMIDKSPVEFVFEPPTVTVRQGDIVRFVQTSTMPHNVEFRTGPDGSSLDEVADSPYLTQPDEVYELLIDDRFSPGEHSYVCTPHEFMGMTGTILVER